MKITVPENISDITLEQFVAYEELRLSEVEELFKEKTINIFTGLDMSLMGDVSKKDIDSLFLDCIKALNVECDFINRFQLDGIEFGFIPNIDSMTGDEYTDVIRYAPVVIGDKGSERFDNIDNLHRLIAVLFRPIKKEGSFNNYTIEEYNGTSEHAELMKLTPMNIVNGCLGFFLTLRQDLGTHFQKYMEEERMKAVQL